MTGNDKPPLRTAATISVVKALLINPDREMYGIQIQHATGNSSGAVSQILRRLASLGWVTSTLRPNPRAGLRDRRYYRLTDTGREKGPDYVEGRGTR